MKKQYFCNPLNMDYRYQFIQDMRSGEDKISREAADPSMILFQGKYYIFASMTLSVWVSEDMVHWESHRLPESLPLYDYAPDVRVVGDYVYFIPSWHDLRFLPHERYLKRAVRAHPGNLRFLGSEPVSR